MAAEDYEDDLTEIPEGPRSRRIASPDGVVVELDEEGAEVYLDGEPEEQGESTFEENLASRLSPEKRRRIADELIEAVKADEESRAEWKSRLERGLELLGLKDRPKEDEPFPGASSATHPLLAEALVQFQANALPELVPSEGPVKTMIVGDKGEERQEQADRVRNYLNYRLMVDDEEWFDDTDQMLFYLPFGGSAFRKSYRDPITGKAKNRYVTAEDFIVPYKAKSLADAQRYTHRLEMHANDLKRAMASGEYVDIHLDPANEPAENDEIKDTSDKREPSTSELDDTHEIYEVHVYYGLDDDDPLASDDFDPPYIITVDATENDVLAIHRNWEEDDESQTKQIWFSHYKFLPGFGFYGFGFLHVIGGLSQAATGALRALLDAAARANLQGGFKSKEARNAKGDAEVEPGKYKDIDLTAEELKNAFFNVPFKEPSRALFELLGGLTEAGQRFSSTTDIQVGDANNNAPVGTTVALIEQGKKVFSGIHRRLHRAAAKEYRLFAELDAAALGDEPYPFRFEGVSGEIRAQDFSDEIDIIPVSDPNIFSSTQRIALAQALVQLVEGSPDLYGAKEKRRAHERLLRAMSVPDVDEILPDVSATRRDPVTENQYMMVGKAVAAFPEQDHAAHMRVHQAALSQYAEAQGRAAEQFRQIMEAHLAEHHAHAYRQRLLAETGIMLPGGLHPEDEPEELPLEAENLVARAMAQRVQPVPSPAERQMSAEQMQVQAQEKRKDAEAQAEQRRKDVAGQAEERRKDMAVQAKLRREGVDFQAEEAREQKEWAAEMRRRFEAWLAEQERDQAEWEAEQRRQAAEAARNDVDRSRSLARENIRRATEQAGD